MDETVWGKINRKIKIENKKKQQNELHIDIDLIVDFQ